VRSRLPKYRCVRLTVFVLLALQLVFGLPLQSIAASAPSAAAHADCVGQHQSQGNPLPAAGHHDCCRTGACQCQCFPTPAAFDVTLFSYVATSPDLPAPADTQFVAPRIDEFLRPPIA
jgi:hypothetical protein